MILHSTTNDFNSNGLKQCNSFKINTNAKSFKILSNPYSNKIKSIIRELAANAYDAHVDANTSHIPFYIKQPTTFEPEFKIRDYGTGLSSIDVENLYTTYFESTKNNDNNTIGAFGLGSKSPFSYTKTFNVISYFNAIKYHYVATSVDGIPNIMFLGQEETTEANGLEVSFNVKEEDISKFQKEAINVLEHFNCNFTSNIPIISFKENYESSIIFDNEKYTLVSITPSNFITKINVKQGNIIYPIDNESILNYFRNKLDNSETLNYKIAYCTLIFKVDIGVVDITPSRESLSYDDETIDNLKMVIDTFFEEAASIYFSLLAKKQPLDILKNIINYNSHIKFKNFFPLTINVHGFNESSTKLYYDKDISIINKSRKDNRTKVKLYNMIDLSYFFNQEVAIVVKDDILSTKSILYKLQKHQFIIFIDKIEEKNFFDILNKKFFNETPYSVYYTSSFKAKKEKGVKRTYVKKTTILVKNIGFIDYRGFLNPFSDYQEKTFYDDCNNNIPFYYFKLNGYSLLDCENIKFDLLKTIINYYCDFKIEKIVGVRKKGMVTLPSCGIDLFEHIKNNLKNNYSQKFMYLSTYKLSKPIKNMNYRLLIEYFTKFPNKKYSNFIVMLMLMKKEIENSNFYYFFLEYANIITNGYFEFIDKTSEFEKEVTQFFENNPLLELSSSNYFDMDEKKKELLFSNINKLLK